MGKPDFANSTKSAEAVTNPPPYSSISENINEPPTYRPPENSHTLSYDRCVGSEGPVAIDDCITHLKFLSAAAKVRNLIRETDKLFGIHDSEAKNFSDPRKCAQGAVRIQEKRWAVYVTRAVDRFATWWQNCLPSSNKSRISMVNDSSETKIVWTADTIPPLDVIMVWHAYMLNPRAFLEDCLRQSKMSVWATGFPWDVINTSINKDTFEFHPGSAARLNFETKTGHCWENINDKPTKSLTCFGCKQEISSQWTSGSIGCDPDVAFAHCVGYADKSLRISCPECKSRITHDSLSVQKLHNDVQRLLKDDVPMPGTLLSEHGTPAHDKNGDKSFPNRLIKEGIRSELLELTDLTENESTTIETIRDRLEVFLKDRSLIRRVNKKALSSGDASLEEKMSLRNMLSRYWDNSSPFAINLIGAVIRQGTFVGKMDDIDWLHSPTLTSNLTGFISKYETFFQIMARNKGHAVVPTLDVDLIWHTHQLSPARYYDFSTTQTEGIFVNHDDKVDEGKLTDAFAWTSRQYQKLTRGKVYSECTCWYCEAVRETHNEGLGRLISQSASQAKANAAILHGRTENTPDGGQSQGPHISSHSAVRIQAQTDPKSIQTKTAQLRSHWEKAQRRSYNRTASTGSDNSHRNPSRDPFQDPYMRDPEIHREAYPCNPACVNATPGAPGNCISGTQGVGLEQGGCVSVTVAAQTRSKGKSFCAGMAGCGMNM
ncbi:unnamed protein product [Penicillium salamii]|uniref:Uncharacterized protein n=1 Tax=Penicillium salamii TaxID=1612424 RepID=A0A9W4JNZ3_9EURO|nr:unnamed protein product [Penicillium salamii]CAG8052372.1 unnamed protein product [Penicillium salamii]CAG8106015.1 unnamed protein product [Penicillium salamii]CAG8276363.1 unnamed protein product [Penicillium salamii]CAG8282853.1 unnamed protein product [Penicillium salamii]